MPDLSPYLSLAALVEIMQFAGLLCQMMTAVIAVTIGVCTFRYTRQQSALTLINQNNTLANLVNSTFIQSPRACEVMGQLTDPIVGRPDDAVLFLYLNYVHNTFRTFQIGAMSRQVWADTLASCILTLTRLERHQVERLLARGYEAAFRASVLSGYDAAHVAAGVARPAVRLTVVGAEAPLVA